MYRLMVATRKRRPVAPAARTAPLRVFESIETARQLLAGPGELAQNSDGILGFVGVFDGGGVLIPVWEERIFLRQHQGDALVIA